jgi:peroxiredoxin
MKQLQIANCRLQIGPIVSTAIVLLVSVPYSAQAAAQELHGTVKVSGSQIEIHVQDKDGRPAAGVNIRLLLGRQQTVAVAHTNDRGRWIHRVDQTGAYEAIIEDGSDVLRLLFTVLNEPTPVRFPWIMVIPCILCVAGAILLLVLGIRSTTRYSPLTTHHAPVGPGRVVLLSMAALLAGGAGLMGWSAWREWNKSSPAVRSGPDLAKEARDYLRKRAVKPLSGSLERLLIAAEEDRIKTKPHSLLGKTAPDFELLDHHQKPWRLSKLLNNGPVILVFYYGYHCNHCVGQLFAVNDDIQKFHELGAQVITVSADPPELTQDRFRQYGEFAFPVLSDPGNKIAQVYGVYQPATGNAPEDLQHGTFIIGRDNQVYWTHQGNYPFTDNGTLLVELARLEGRLAKE